MNRKVHPHMLINRWADRLQSLLSTPARWHTRSTRLQESLEQVQINQGVLLSAWNAQQGGTRLQDHEFKVFSQWGEDGILQHLVRTVGIEHQTFIEFGVEDFTESNCRLLLMKDNWQGYVIDGSRRHIQALKQAGYYWKHDLQAVQAFITRENINELLSSSGFDQDLGILSVDLDGNDYHVLAAISHYRPRILVCEYNAVFGSQRKISVPYEANFQRTARHSSNLYFGASLAALTHLAEQKGYTLVGTNSAGCNAFFVRNDRMTDGLPRLTADAAFVASKFRESRDNRGALTHERGEARLRLIAGMPVVNVETGALESL